MSWVAIALLGTAVMGMINILDKVVIVRYFHSPLTLPFLIGIAQGGVGIVLITALRWPGSAPLSSVAWAVFSGALMGLGALFLLRLLYTQEVSRVVPAFNSFPLFAAIIAVIFLDERLSSLHWVAIVATVTGAAALSVGRTPESGYRGLVLHRSFFALMLGSLIFAGSMVTSKVALDDLPVLNTHGLRSLGLGAVLLAASLRPVAVQEVRRLVRQRRAAFAVVGLNELVLATVSLLLTLWALSLGPVSFVTTVVASRSFFVLLYSTLLSLRFGGLLEERVTRGTVAVKAVSTALIVGGVATISL